MKLLTHEIHQRAENSKVKKCNDTTIKSIDD